MLMKKVKVYCHGFCKHLEKSFKSENVLYIYSPGEYSAQISINIFLYTLKTNF